MGADRPAAPPPDREVSHLATAVLDALSPFLPPPATPPEPSRTPPRELRAIDAALSRLRAALRLAERSNARLLDHGAATDVSHALREAREIAARAGQGLAARPRIYAVERPKGFAAWVVGSAKRADRALADGDGGLARISLGAEERKRLELAANKIDTNVQVALWKCRASLLPDADARDPQLARLPSHHYPVLRKGRLGMPRPRMGRKGRVFSTGEMHAGCMSPPAADVPSLLSAASASPAVRPDEARRLDSTLRDKRGRQSVASSSERGGPPERPWEFSLIESPITPLRSRTLATAEDGVVVMAMWRGARVSVKVIRRDKRRFYDEGDYLYALGQSPNIPALLGGHWENAAKGSKGKGKGSKRAPDDDAHVGYLVMEVANGVSLDKLVRDGKLTDTVSQIRVLDRVVAALVFAQKVRVSMTHQDLHPGNILLVPSPLKHEPEPEPVPASSSDSTRVQNTLLIAGTSSRVSQSTVGESTVGTDANKSSHDGDDDADAEADAVVDVDDVVEVDNGDEGDTNPPVVTPALSPDLVFPPRPVFPHIPKIEDEGPENLTVLQRVELHNRLDEAAEADFRHGHVSIPMRAGAASDASKASRASAVTAPPPPPPPPAPTNVVLPMPTDSQRKGAHKTSPTPVSSFTVKVMDFAPAAEADGSRTALSWNSNDAIAGYCAPEKATSRMWRKMQHNREKERERERELERERRLAASRSASNGRHSPRPTTRRRSSNGAGFGAALGTRAGSDTHRRPFDSETYALFEDDHLGDLGEADDNSLGPDIVPQSPTDRSGRRVAARGPDAFKEDDLLGSPVDGGDADAFLFGSSHDDAGMYNGRDQLLMDEAMPIKPSTRSMDVTDADGDTSLHDNGMSKIDVWSIGWLLYYMATGKHPPADSWARRIAIDERDLRNVGRETREIIMMCIQRDVTQRACIRDVKRHIDSILQGLMFAKGLALIDIERDAAFVLLDKAVGIKSSPTRGSAGISSRSASASADGDPGTTISSAEAHSLDETSSILKSSEHRVLGLNQKTRMALAVLPLVVVRRVEWEAAARYLRRSEGELQRLRRALVNERWNKADVIDGSIAVEYLSKRSEEGAASAQSALGWVYRWGAGGVKKNVHDAMRLWEKAVSAGDPEAANGLGLVYHHGRENIEVDGDRARNYYQLAVDQGYPAAAVNLGVMLHDGAAGLPLDGAAARSLYEMACRHGDAIAANNLGLLLQHGASGVQPDAPAAVRAYELAIERNERHHACRNLGELLWDGAPGVQGSRTHAVEYFALAIAHGDTSSRSTARGKLRKLVRQAEQEQKAKMSEALLERCRRLLEAC